MGLVNRRVRGLFLLALVMTWGALPPSHAQRLSQNPPGFCQDLLATAPLSPAELFSSEWPKERRKLFLDRLVERAGITLSSQTLVQNSLTLEEAQGRIAPNFADLRRNLRDALSKGKKLLVLNGSFDLVHAGHVGMVQASLHNFMIRENLRREEVYLVVLADADPLIFSSKKHKWVKFGGSESLPRPLQSWEWCRPRCTTL